MKDVEAEIITKLRYFLDDGGEVPRGIIREAIQNGSIHLLSVVYEIIEDSKMHNRIVPSMTITDTDNVYIKYCVKCILNSNNSFDEFEILSPYEAAYAINQWIRCLVIYGDDIVSEELIKNWLKTIRELIFNSNEYVLNCVVCGIFEHLFKCVKCVKKFQSLELDKDLRVRSAFTLGLSIAKGGGPKAF